MSREDAAIGHGGKKWACITAVGQTVAKDEFCPGWLQNRSQKWDGQRWDPNQASERDWCLRIQGLRPVGMLALNTKGIFLIRLVGLQAVHCTALSASMFNAFVHNS